MERPTVIESISSQFVNGRQADWLIAYEWRKVLAYVEQLEAENADLQESLDDCRMSAKVRDEYN